LNLAQNGPLTPRSYGETVVRGVTSLFGIRQVCEQVEGAG
jgi:hypothetical protein